MINLDRCPERWDRQRGQAVQFGLNVIRIELPPLRERREDLLPLVDRFLTRASARQRLIIMIFAMSYGNTESTILVVIATVWSSSFWMPA